MPLSTNKQQYKQRKMMSNDSTLPMRCSVIAKLVGSKHKFNQKQCTKKGSRNPYKYIAQETQMIMIFSFSLSKNVSKIQFREGIFLAWLCKTWRPNLALNLNVVGIYARLWSQIKNPYEYGREQMANKEEIGL